MELEANFNFTLAVLKAQKTSSSLTASYMNTNTILLYSLGGEKVMPHLSVHQTASINIWIKMRCGDVMMMKGFAEFFGVKLIVNNT